MDMGFGDDQSRLAMWSAATCRRFPLFGAASSQALPTIQDKSGSAANESCDKSQHSTYLPTHRSP
jgi:hypothetical protein